MGALPAKDTGSERPNTRRFRRLDPTSYRLVSQRAWAYGTVGPCHGKETWRDLVGALRLSGFDKAPVIKREDGLVGEAEGVGAGPTRSAAS